MVRHIKTPASFGSGQSISSMMCTNMIMKVSGFRKIEDFTNGVSLPRMLVLLSSCVLLLKGSLRTTLHFI